MDTLTTIKSLIDCGKVDDAIEQLDRLLLTDFPHKDQLYYLCGNAYRKQANWQMALNNYRRAMDINPQSPAAQAHRMVTDILNFYHKDMYNQ